MRAIFSFDEFITPRIIRLVFAGGLILLVLTTLAQIVALLPYYGIFSGLILPVAGLLVVGLLWRIYCEIILVFFDIREKVASIANRPLR